MGTSVGWTTQHSRGVVIEPQGVDVMINLSTKSMCGRMFACRTYDRTDRRGNDV